MTLSPENGRTDGDMEKPKHKHPTFIQNLSKYFTEYCDHTGIHGFKYIGEPGRLIFERIWWIIFFSFSLYLSIDLILATYRKWDTSPFIVSFAQNPTPIWDIPFPAVTICSETKSRKSKFNFTNAYHQKKNNNVSEEVLNQFSTAALVCDSAFYYEGNKTIGWETVEYLVEIAPSFDDTIWECKWTNKNETCDSMFSPVLTEEGLCFTFNMLDREQLLTNVVDLDENYLNSGQESTGWTLEGGYPADADENTYPRRAIFAGTRSGLAILLRTYQQDLDYICRGPIQGFKILLHNPMDIPRISTQYFRVSLDQDVVVSVRPDMLTTSEGLKNYDPHQRKCYFLSERQLLFFKVYTQQNCQLECLTNYTLNKCDCVAYHMPRDKATPICGVGSMDCVRDAERELQVEEIKGGLRKNSRQFCDCLPSCTSINYNAETSQADFKWDELFKAYMADVNEFPPMKISRLTISFKEMQFITSQRSQLLGSTDFLANCGGLLGLFTGFSFLSTIEIIYFLTLRLFCNIKKFGKHFWSGSPDLLV